MAFYHCSPAIFSKKCMYKTKKNKIGQEEKKSIHHLKWT